MSASIAEQILQRAAVVLINATDARRHIFRGRVDALGDDELPGINLRRASTGDDPLGTNGARQLISFDIAFEVKVAADWETAVDALHMQGHAALMADAGLAALGRGLRCVGTDTMGDSADQVAGRLTARYQIQVFVRPGDLTRGIN